MMAPPSGQTVTKNFDFWSTQKYSKVSKICSACVEIFLRVSYMLKPTVLSFSACWQAERVEILRFAEDEAFQTCVLKILETLPPKDDGIS